MADVTERELEEVARRVREIRRRNTIARIAGTAIGIVTLIGATVSYHWFDTHLVAYVILGVGMVLAGVVWQALESKVHVDEL